MRRIAATWVLPVSSSPLRNGVVELNENGQIVSLTGPVEKLRDQSGLEFYDGILVPGFVNAHTHLELSWLYQSVPMHSGLSGFLKALTQVPPSEDALALPAVTRALDTMQREGTVAAGDIMNTALSLPAKQKTGIRIHSFIELLDLPASRHKVWEEGTALFRKTTADSSQKCSASMVPHAPYTVSATLVKKIASFSCSHPGPLSIHNQETLSENDLFRSGTGTLAETLRELKVQPDPDFRGAPSPLQAMLPLLPDQNNLLLVHNTFTTETDTDFALLHHHRLFWVLCPNANLYIENQLPPVSLLRKKKCTIALGTDSLASNSRLSILDEMKALSVFFPEIPLDEMLHWACLNGAKALEMDKELGSIEPGKRPGLVLIEHADHQQIRLTAASTARRIDIGWRKD